MVSFGSLAFSHISSFLIVLKRLDVSTVSVKTVGTLFSPLALPMLVYKIWWVSWDKQHWEDKETAISNKKNYFCLRLYRLIVFFIKILPTSYFASSLRREAVMMAHLPTTHPSHTPSNNSWFMQSTETLNAILWLGVFRLELWRPWMLEYPS